MRLFYRVSRHRAIPFLMLVGSGFVLCQMLGFISEYCETLRRFEFKISELVMADVGQGDGFMVRLWNGNIAFVDVGEFDEKFISAIRKPSIQNFGKKESLHADLIFLSHDDADHAGALDGVWRLLKKGKAIGSIILSDYQYKNVDKIKNDIKKTDQGHAPKIIRTARNDAFAFSTGDTIDVLFPNHNQISGFENVHGEAPDEGSENPTAQRSGNDDSIVMKFSIASTSIMFTGDASEIVEKNLIRISSANPKSLKSDILKVGHHGSKTSSSEDFIKYVDPLMAVISVGKNNRYKHPTKEALIRLNQDGRRIIRTDQCGTYRVLIFPDGAIETNNCYSSTSPASASAKNPKRKRTRLKVRLLPASRFRLLQICLEKRKGIR